MKLEKGLSLLDQSYKAGYQKAIDDAIAEIDKKIQGLESIQARFGKSTNSADIRIKELYAVIAYIHQLKEK